MDFQLEDLLKVALAVVVGGIIGIEREFRDKAAGFRTLIFICVGSTLFTLCSFKLAGDKDPTRIASNIVSGVGFLGAGVILRDGGRVIGLTTASTVWLTAALGMGIGGGYYGLTGVTALLALIVLWAFPRVEKWINDIREERTYEIVCRLDLKKPEMLDAAFHANGLRAWRSRQIKTGDTITITYQASGSAAAHERIMAVLFADEDVKEFRF
jgi:putative Mg2+ transporter-C (MgtC) family protein